MCSRRRVNTCPCAVRCACPSSARNQLCRPVDGFHKLHTPCKWCRKARINDWDLWYGRDIKVFNDLAYTLEKPIHKIAELMYDFTLQNYSDILNPKGKGWNHCRVPLSHGDICERYLSIFDLDGNLRDPTHPRSLFRLLQVIKTISTSDIADIAEPTQSIPIHDLATVRFANEANGNKTNNPVKNIDLDYLRTKKSQEPRQFDMYAKPDVHSILTQSHASNKPIDHNIKIDTPNVRRATISLHDSDLLLVDKKGRRRGQGSNQLDSLRLHQKLILHKMLRKNLKDEDPSRFLAALAKTDLNESSPKQLKRVQAAQHISNFYSATVSDEPKHRHTVQGLKARKQEHRPELQPAQTNVQQRPVKERRYYGESLPVLFHEPYDTNKRTTWLRRHPDQLRMQEDGQVGMARVRRYRRESVMKALQQARNRWSIHSINSPPEEPAVESITGLHKKPEYRRVFSSTSRRVRNSKHNRVNNSGHRYPRVSVFK
ncbi:uncharacterized protein LOC115760282 [Drosophila novamexicana]|uniref:uncharacterized protein LOC115760282 n=1 Tax=Drosophila novamexicana TaxID=47314 RepID=UPI0011E5C281|nr:uncharacterized protein LOC115760282 [Drosophila novamexicana]